MGFQRIIPPMSDGSNRRANVVDIHAGEEAVDSGQLPLVDELRGLFACCDSVDKAKKGLQEDFQRRSEELELPDADTLAAPASAESPGAGVPSTSTGDDATERASTEPSGREKDAGESDKHAPAGSALATAEFLPLDTDQEEIDRINARHRR